MQTATLPAEQHLALLGAVQAVNDRQRETEYRRFARDAAQAATARPEEAPEPSEATVRVPSSTFESLLVERRAAAALRRVFDSGPVMPVAFDVRAPHRLREATPALTQATGRCVARGLLGRPLAELFDAAARPALQAALARAQADVVLELAAADGARRRCHLHLVSADPLDDGLRRAYLVAVDASPA